MSYDSNIITAAEARNFATTLDYANQVEAMFINALIQTAAKAGEFRVICQHKISDTVTDELVSKGYTITHVDISSAPQYVISWKDDTN